MNLFKFQFFVGNFLRGRGISNFDFFNSDNFSVVNLCGVRVMELIDEVLAIWMSMLLNAKHVLITQY
jgi:hypothetical protein